MVLEKILTADNVVVAINQNIDMLLEEVPELKIRFMEFNFTFSI